MAQAGIDLSVLSCLLGWSAPIEECRLINEDLAAVQAKYPGKFVGLAQAPILEGKAALEELRGAVGDLGLGGVTITSQVGALPLDSPKLYDFMRPPAGWMRRYSFTLRWCRPVMSI